MLLVAAKACEQDLYDYPRLGTIRWPDNSESQKKGTPDRTDCVATVYNQLGEDAALHIRW